MSTKDRNSRTKHVQDQGDCNNSATSLPSIPQLFAYLCLQVCWKSLRHEIPININNINSLLIQAKKEIKIERSNEGPGTALDYVTETIASQNKSTIFGPALEYTILSFKSMPLNLRYLPTKTITERIHCLEIRSINLNI